MTEKTAKRIAKSLEILSGQATDTPALEDIAKKLNGTFIKEAKDMVDSTI